MEARTGMSWHGITSHRTTQHHTAPHQITLHYTTLYYTTPYHTNPFFIILGKSTRKRNIYNDPDALQLLNLCPPGPAPKGPVSQAYTCPRSDPDPLFDLWDVLIDAVVTVCGSRPR